MCAPCFEIAVYMSFKIFKVLASALGGVPFSHPATDDCGCWVLNISEYWDLLRCIVTVIVIFYLCGGL